MARKKNTPAAAPGIPPDQLARMLETQARLIEEDKARRSKPVVHVNTDLIPTDSLLRSAEGLLDRHQLYDELAVTGAACWGELYANVRWAAEKVLEELKAAGIPSAEGVVCWVCGRTPEAADRSQGIRFLMCGVYRLLGAIEQSPFAVISWSMGQKQVGVCVRPGEVFRFDPAALAEIRAAVGLLRRAAPQEKAPDEITWTPYKGVQEWARLFGVKRNTMGKRLKAQNPRNQRLNRRNYRLAIEDLPPTLRARFVAPA
jgi:hypothetical protein